MVPSFPERPHTWPILLFFAVHLTCKWPDTGTAVYCCLSRWDKFEKLPSTLYCWGNFCDSQVIVSIRLPLFLCSLYPYAIEQHVFLHHHQVLSSYVRTGTMARSPLHQPPWPSLSHKLIDSLVFCKQQEFKIILVNGMKEGTATHCFMLYCSK